jgi:hypothetical protein
MKKYLTLGVLATATFLASGGPAVAEDSQGGDGSIELAITNFQAIPGANNLWTLQGMVSGADPVDLIVVFDGVVVDVAYVDEGGCFSLTVEVPPQVAGIVSAQAWTWYGAYSNLAEDFIGP